MGQQSYLVDCEHGVAGGEQEEVQAECDRLDQDQARNGAVTRELLFGRGELVLLVGALDDTGGGQGHVV